ncbi:hypothetical protein BMF77_03907 [Dolichospermum sp. UHCC 0315A]|jgi:hypothetical protein|nr:MAG: hypothetical protein AN485_03385 [Anabaena sp. MDT14b]QEI43291.1 hypothetical protein BMF77_03907 [Dolichospermum sp. UHCC 0315A]
MLKIQPPTIIDFYPLIAAKDKDDTANCHQTCYRWKGLNPLLNFVWQLIILVKFLIYKDG